MEENTILDRDINNSFCEALFLGLITVYVLNFLKKEQAFM